ncbi:NAD(P)H-hydrate dehydratase [Echinicola sp. CAU 1574]|uniref:Bifunctional NAD(P)H-hydrate repair enzyme n=1 Tax=Echinicola arenosa TaxID=2774144 RepID=A0ABR9ANR6_9BACT|nr:NAD(P)H-hydrate dehydratase [Echinicola arenosa]MBD8490425.1 NAD(P)H-hydrate dehydratase [Echinicola arenosa]
MLEIISGRSVKKLDADFISDRGITSHRLMENAAQAFCDWFEKKYHRNDRIGICCGHGNNGGDGLAIARLLWRKGFDVVVFLVGDHDNASADCRLNRELLPDKLPAVSLTEEDIQHIEFDFDVIIDALLGIGVNRPLSGDFLALVKRLNRLIHVNKIAVDIPSGLPSDECVEGDAFIADITISFQFPKYSLLFPEHAGFVGHLKVANIGISQPFFGQFSEGKYYLQYKDVAKRHLRFGRFSHKGDFGKVLVCGGSYGSMGALKMAATASLRTGSGLVTCLAPKCGMGILQSSLPEAQVLTGEGENELAGSVDSESLSRFDAIGIGPGMGTSQTSSCFLGKFLENYKGPLVIDADGINILAKQPGLLNYLNENVILTPHVKEFERLVGPCQNHKERLDKALEFSMKHGCILILKGAHTAISLPNGKQYFNSTGNKHMATGGSGDVLTGMITSFLGQGYSVENAAVCGVYQHGLAGQIASKNRLRGTIASDIVEAIPRTYILLKID